MKKVRKAFKKFKRELEKAFKSKSKKEIVIKFPLDTRFEFIISKFKIETKKAIKVELRKDCCSITKNGDYHLLYQNTYLNHEEGAPDWVMSACYPIIIEHKCRCKKDQKKKAKAMISTAKRVNGKWVY